jgi:hypothetical protein
MLAAGLHSHFVILAENLSDAGVRTSLRFFCFMSAGIVLSFLVIGNLLQPAVRRIG